MCSPSLRAPLRANVSVLYRVFLSFIVLCFSSCASPRPAPAPPPLPAPPAAAPAAPPNLEVLLSEVIERADEDGLSYAKVFIDGAPAGRTDTAPRSREKRWEGRVEPGNHPVRLELWVLPDLGEWRLLPDGAQPRERFVRIAEGETARLGVRRDAGGRYDFTVGRTK